MPNKTQINIKISPRLKEEIDAAAEAAGESRTTFLEAAAERELERRRMARQDRQGDDE